MQDASYKDCRICGSRFRKNPKYSRAQWRDARYCSVACMGRSKRVPPRARTCERCGEEYYRPASIADWQWANRRFCSRRCLNLKSPVATPPLTHEVAWAAGLYEGYRLMAEDRIVLDPSRSTWTCFGCDVPPGVSQCPKCGGVRFNHTAKMLVARAVEDQVRLRERRPDDSP